MGDSDNGFLREIAPLWDDAGVFDMTAVPKSPDAQYGSMIVPGTEVRVALGYRRYRDCDKNDNPGQDFAVVRGDRRHLVGVLADGVGQSFFGNLAAERVSNWLLRELWRNRTDPPAEDKIEAGLKRAEQDLSQSVEGYSLEHLPDWHRKALEATRRAGSQAVFAAFVWEFGRRSGYLYQVGDAVAVLFRDDGPEKIDAHPKGRWSSAGKSQMHLRRTAFADISAILIKSDGADPAWGLDIDRQISDGDSFLKMATVRAEGDDVSFVAACLASESAALRTGFSRYADSPIQPGRAVPASRAGSPPKGSERPRVSESTENSEPTAPPSAAPVAPARSRPDLRWFGAGVVVGLLLSAGAEEIARAINRKSQSAVGKTGQQVAPRQTGGGPAKGTPQAQTLPVVPAQTGVTLLDERCDGEAADVKKFPGLERTRLLARVQSHNIAISGLSVEGDRGLPFTLLPFILRTDRDPKENVWYVFLPGVKRNRVTLHVYLKPSGTGADTKDFPIDIEGAPGCRDLEFFGGATVADPAKQAEAVK